MPMESWFTLAVMGALVVFLWRPAIWPAIETGLTIAGGLFVTAAAAVAALASIAWIALPLVLIFWLLSGCSGEAGDPPVCETEPGVEYLAWQDEQYTHVQRKDLSTSAAQVRTIEKGDTLATIGDVTLEVREDMTVCLIPTH